MLIKKTRIVIDILMIAAMPFLVAYSLIGDDVHEVIGVGIFALFIIHHIINWRWWPGIFKGRYNSLRILNTTFNLLLAAFMLLQPISGILMSKYVLKEITISGAAGTLRAIHMTVSYWGFILAGFHLGLHVRPFIGKLKKRMNKGARLCFTVLFLLIAAYGVYAFIRRGIGDYLLMKVMFAFFDFSESRIVFLLDYMAVLVLVACLGYYIQSGMIWLQKKKSRKEV